MKREMFEAGELGEYPQFCIKERYVFAESGPQLSPIHGTHTTQPSLSASRAHPRPGVTTSVHAATVALELMGRNPRGHPLPKANSRSFQNKALDLL